MQSPRTESALPFDIYGSIEERKVSLFHVRLVVISFLIALVDGYELSIPGLVAPNLVKAFSIPHTALGFLFSAGLAGMVLGAFVFAFVGDRYGRKPGVIWGSLVFGIFTVVSTWAGNLETLIALRFLAGIGIAGIIPNLVSLNAEYLPRNVRSFLIGIVLVGVPIGGAVAAATSSILLPLYGWKSLFLVGGTAAVVLSLALLPMLPESLKYLALRRKDREKLKKLTIKIYCTEQLPDGGPLTSKSTEERVGVSPGPLLTPEYSTVTLLIWLLCFINYATLYFLFSWMPTVFRAHGISAEQSGVLLSIMQFGGVVGTLTVSALMSRFGVLVLGFLMLCAIPALWILGLPHPSLLAVGVCGVVVHLCATGCQTGLIVSSGLVYDTSVRAKGAGWAAGVGRVGAVLGPLSGSLLLQFIPLERILVAPIIPLIVCAAGTIVLSRVLFKKFGNLQIGEMGASHR